MWFPDKRLQIVVISQQLSFISVHFLKIKLRWLWGPPDFSSCATIRFTVVALLGENKYWMDCHEIRYGQSCPVTHNSNVKSGVNTIIHAARSLLDPLVWDLEVRLFGGWAPFLMLLCWQTDSPAHIVTDAYIVTTENLWDMLMIWQKPNRLRQNGTFGDSAEYSGLEPPLILLWFTLLA